MKLSTERNLPSWFSPGDWYRGAALVLQRQLPEAMAQIREGIAAYRRSGKLAYVPVALGFLTEALGQAGQTEEALDTLAEALALVQETEERHWEAELHRLRGELLLNQGDEAGAEASLKTAIEVARRQQARSWELRATTSLARLWQALDRGGDARDLLAEIYGWFTEGFDTPDLLEAHSLLEELAEGSPATDQRQSGYS
jgi:predicted ATPase